MRTLVSTDLHSSPRAAEAIDRALGTEDVDAHICLGDIITFRPLEYLEALFIDPPVPTFTIPGNTDGEDARARLEELGLDIHFKRVDVEGVTVAGVGGCTPPPFRTAFVVEEEEYARRAPPVLEDTEVLASHGPVHGILDRSLFGGVHVGSRALREAVDTARPRVVLSGHIHEAKGLVRWSWDAGAPVGKARDFMDLSRTPDSLFFNPGPAKDGYLGVLTVEDDLVSAEVTRL